MNLKFVSLRLATLSVERPFRLVSSPGDVDGRLSLARAKGFVVVFQQFLVLLRLQVLRVVLSKALLLVLHLVHLMAVNRLESLGLSSHAQLGRAARDILVITGVLLILIFSALLLLI
jgi:hypothetical protein